MKLKYYLMGLGIGIFITTLVLSIGNKKEKLSDEEIIARARELGMVMKDETKDSLEDVIEKSLDKSGLKSGDFAKNDNQANKDALSLEETQFFETAESVSENKDDTNNLNEDADKPETAETDTGAQNFKDTETDDNKIPEVTEADKETADADNAENDEKQDEIADENNMAADEDKDVTGEDELASEDANTDDGSEAGYVTFTITRGMTSYDVARLLYQKGLINDAKDFDMYIIRKGKASVIRVGTYSLPKNASYEEILKAIT